MVITTELQLVINASMMGAVYGLNAIGLSLAFGTMRIINIAHGALYMLGGYVAYTVLTTLGVNIIVATAIAMVIMFLMGLALENVFIERFRSEADAVAIITLALAILFEQGALLVWGGIPRGVPPLTTAVVEGFSLYVEVQRFIIFAISISLSVGLSLFLAKTKMGRAIRLVTFGEEIAKSVGINVTRISMLVFGLATALVVAAGSLSAPLSSLHPTVGWSLLLTAFIVVVIGGLESVNGTIVAGFIYALVEAFAGFYIGSQWKGIVALIMVIAVLTLRPHGLLGKPVVRF